MCVHVQLEVQQLVYRTVHKLPAFAVSVPVQVWLDMFAVLQSTWNDQHAFFTGNAGTGELSIGFMDYKLGL